jgi:hypothetical protein
MVYWHHEHHLVVRDCSGLQHSVFDQPLDKAEIGYALPNQRGNRFRISHCEFDGQARIGGAESMDNFWQPIVADGLAGSEVERSHLQSGKVCQHKFRRRGARKDGLCLNQEYPAGIGQCDTPANTVE